MSKVHVSPKITPEQIDFTIYDTSSAPHDFETTTALLRLADVILLITSTDIPDSFSRVETYWIPLLEKLKITVPLIVAINKAPLPTIPSSTSQFNDSSLDKQLKALNCDSLLSNRRIDAIHTCSAKHLYHISDLFYIAQRAVLSPIRVLYDTDKQILRPSFVTALTRVYRTFTGHHPYMAYAIFVKYNEVCWDVTLEQRDYDDIIALLKRESNLSLPDAPPSLTLDAFLFLHLHLLRTRHHVGSELCWQVLERNGYEAYRNEIRLRDDIGRVADTIYELSEVGAQYLTNLFMRYDSDHDGGLTLVRNGQQKSDIEEVNGVNKPAV